VAVLLAPSPRGHMETAKASDKGATVTTAGASDKGATAVHTGGAARSDKDTSPAEQLSVTVIALLLACLVGDVASLCAAACVARAWRDAAATPSLWVRLDGLKIRCMERLTDSRLQSFVARALDAGGVTSLRLFRTPVTDEGLLQALSQQQQPVLHFTAGAAFHSSNKLTGKGIATALKRSGGHLQTLKVSGLPPLGAPEQEDIVRQHGASSRVALLNARREVLSELLSLMAPGCSLDATGFCAEDVEHPENKAITYTCGILCDPGHACHDIRCRKLVCFAVPFHSASCDWCNHSFCNDCMRGAFVGGEDTNGMVCERCARIEEELEMQGRAECGDMY
jgi:hypothetical protein